MPARGRVWRCSRVALLSRMEWCAQRGLSKFVKLPSGRSHLASLFGMSCISALLLGLCCNAGCSLLQRSDGVIALHRFCSSLVLRPALMASRACVASVFCEAPGRLASVFTPLARAFLRAQLPSLDTAAQVLKTP